MSEFKEGQECFWITEGIPYCGIEEGSVIISKEKRECVIVKVGAHNKYKIKDDIGREIWVKGNELEPKFKFSEDETVFFSHKDYGMVRAKVLRIMKEYDGFDYLIKDKIHNEYHLALEEELRKAKRISELEKDDIIIFKDGSTARILAKEFDDYYGRTVFLLRDDDGRVTLADYEYLEKNTV
ncbi:MAG: hypothetical protein ACOCRO_03905 [Halanaerobiales bacterium]